MAKPLVERVDTIRVDSNGQAYVTINGEDHKKRENVRKLEEVDLPESIRSAYFDWPVSFSGELTPNIIYFYNQSTKKRLEKTEQWQDCPAPLNPSQRNDGRTGRAKRPPPPVPLPSPPSKPKKRPAEPVADKPAKKKSKKQQKVASKASKPKVHVLLFLRFVCLLLSLESRVPFFHFHCRHVRTKRKVSLRTSQPPLLIRKTKPPLLIWKLRKISLWLRSPPPRR